MKIAILSGKGGTGKTLVSVNLAAVSSVATYKDCDIEAPNGHLFFKPDLLSEKNITLKVPVINLEKCKSCRTCVNFCKFNALAMIKGEVKVFSNLCHACGGCALFCPSGAIEEVERSIGRIISGKSGETTVQTGILEIGEATGVPIIKALLEEEHGPLTFIDCPPGTACAAMESVKDSEFCIVVAEPTVFGAQNLEMVHDLLKVLKKPFAVVLNKCGSGFNPSEAFCNAHDVKIIGRIPFDHMLGHLTSEGMIATREKDLYYEWFRVLLDSVLEEATSCL